MNMEFCSLLKGILFASIRKALTYDKLRSEVLQPTYYLLIQKTQG